MDFTVNVFKKRDTVSTPPTANHEEFISKGHSFTNLHWPTLATKG